MPIITETREEFIARHGGNPRRTRESLRLPVGVFILPDGATYDWNGMIERRAEPPTNPAQLLSLRRVYHAEWLEDAEKDFHRLKAILLGGPNGLPFSERFAWDETCEQRYGAATSGDAVGALELIAAFVGRERKALARIDARIEALRESGRDRAAEAINKFADDQVLRQAEDLRSRLEAVVI